MTVSTSLRPFTEFDALDKYTTQKCPALATDTFCVTGSGI